MRSWPARPPKIFLLFLLALLCSCGLVETTPDLAEPALGALAGPAVQGGDGLVSFTTDSFASRVQLGVWAERACNRKPSTEAARAGTV